ncbi:hypothetical protein PF001_g2696 [Phytophthora fragariae]|nr:hypothetical protein PF006_g2488 [Phytophthora fragariae]KAE9325897.1 hypothetical protein PF001_g2696 [Phytophthora fragariae]
MTVVPLMIFVPYVEAFDIPTKLFKNGDFLYDPVATTKLVLENRLIFASSLFDFGTKLIPQLSIILSLVTVSELVAYSEVKVIPGEVKETIPSMAVKSAVTKPESRILSTENKYAVNSQSSDQSGLLRALLKRKNVIVITIFVLWGTIVLILHSMAVYRAAHYEVVGCRAVTRPWFLNGKEPCSSLVYDCRAQGTKSPSPNSFSKMDPAALSTLAIVHCPALVMPPDIQRFSKLIMVHIYNSTISNWDADSSISATARTRLLSVLIGRTNMAEFPQGLLQSLPATMMSVQFSETNLAQIPEDLYLRWHFLAMVVFEKGLLTSLPYEMFFLPTYKMSFAGNRIETIPALAMMPPGMIYAELVLKDNPLKELPAQLTDPTAFILSLNVENTSVSTIPEWVKTQTTVVWTYDTPFCGAPMTDPELAYKALCVQHPVAQGSNFPMYLFEELYPFE